MKKIVLFIFTILFFSCTQNEVSPSEPVDPNAAKYPSTVTYYNGLWTSIFNLSYDTQHRLVQIVEDRESLPAYCVFTLTYDNNDRLTLIDQLGQEQHTIAFTYDDLGHVSSWKYDDMVPRLVTFTNGIYAVSVANIQTFHSFDADNDVLMVNSGGQSTFSYEVSKKGPFKHVVGNYQLFSIYLDSFMLFFGSKKPLLSITSGPTSSTVFTNTFDSQDYLTSYIGTRTNGTQSWATIVYGD
jgi:YD repeat-containing protein